MNKAVIYVMFLALALAMVQGCSNVHDNASIEINTRSTGLESPEYSLIFNRTSVEEYELAFTSENWERLQENPFEYVPGTLQYKDETYLKVGIRYKGNSSFHGVPPPKRPFKIDFNRYVGAQQFHGVKKLNLSNSLWDPTMMREMLAYDVFSSAGCPAGKTSHVQLYVTVPGIYEREFFGVYVLIEQVDREYLAHRFGDNRGNLYKAAMWGGDLKWHGNNASTYKEHYIKKTNIATDDWSDLIHFLDILNNTPIDTFKTEIEKVLNIDGFLSYLAANTVLSNLDSIAGRNCNFYLYHNPVTDKFEFLPWDLNEALGNHTLPRDNGLTADGMLTLDIRSPVSDGEHVLIERILSVPEYMSDYLARVHTLVEGEFSPEHMYAKISSTYHLIREHVYRDVYKEYPNEIFDQSINSDVPDNSNPERILGLKSYIEQRVGNILEQLGIIGEKI